MARPDYFEVHGRQYHSVRQLLARGWSLDLIEVQLGDADVLHETSMGLRKCYRRDRVATAESTSLEVARALAGYWQGKAAAACARAKHHVRRAEYLDFWNRHPKLMHEVQELLLEEQDHD